MTSIYDVQVKCLDCDEVTGPDRPPRKQRAKYIGLWVVAFAFIGLAIGFPVGVASAGVGFVAYFFTIPLGIIFGVLTGRWWVERKIGAACGVCGSSL